MAARQDPNALIEKRGALRAVLYADAAQAELKRALPVSMGVEPERFLRQVMTMVQKTPELLDCTPGSIYAGVIQAAELGLELAGPLGQAWLVPRWNKKAKSLLATFQMGYKGYIQLAFRSQQVRRFTPMVVHAHDLFKVKYGLEQNLIHERAEGERGEPIHYYACIELTNGGRDFHDMTKQEVLDHRQRYAPPPADRPDYSAWASHFDAMAMKTCCAALGRRCVMATELHQAASLDTDNELLASPLAERGDEPPEEFTRTELLDQKLSDRGKEEPAPDTKPT